MDIQLEDYRNITGQFDKVASIEMMEALGDRYLETYFAKIHSLLKPDGLVRRRISVSCVAQHRA